MRLKLYEDAIRAKSKSSKGDKSIDPDDSDDSRVEAASPARAAADPPVPAEDRPDVDPVPQPSPGGPSRPPTRAQKTSDAGSVKSTAALPMDESTSYAIKARTEMVHKVLEGLRDEAFELARDIGIEALTAPGGLRDFISRMRNVVFPRAAEEARELFRAGQRNGALARQGGESMLSYVSRRRRWWKLLKSLDSSIELSEPIRVELLLELSGLSRQEALVIKACTSDAKSFEAVSATLVEHYSGTHLKEGRSLGGGGTFQDRRNPSSNFGTRSRAGPKGYGKGKGKGFTRRAYIAEDEAQFAYDDAYHHEDEDAEEYDGTSYPAFGDETDYEPHSYPAAEEEEDPSYEEFELVREAIVSVMEQSPASPSWGFVPTAMVARGRSPGRHKGKGKGKPKVKGKPQAPEQPPTTTAEPEFYRISDPFGADTFLGSRDPEMDADYREAILLESFRAESELNDPFPGGSSDDGAPGSYNVEELDDALERQNAEDEAQRELDEAFARARQQIAGEEEPDTITVLESASAQANRLQVRHVAGRELQRLDYQARNPVHIPAVPH